MDNNELLSQVLVAMQEQSEVLAKMIRESEERTSQRITRLEIKIENDVTKRIDALFDGYKLTHEKQWELERRTEQLQSLVEDLQARILALESKIA